MHGLCNYTDRELEKMERKVETTGDLSEREIEYAKNLAKLKMALLTNEAMENEIDYSHDGRNYEYNRGGNLSNARGGRSYDGNMGGMSNARGRMGNVRRDDMGRYSRDEAEDDLMGKLHEYMNMVDEPEKKQEIKRFMKKLGEM